MNYNMSLMSVSYMSHYIIIVYHTFINNLFMLNKIKYKERKLYE